MMVIFEKILKPALSFSPYEAPLSSKTFVTSICPCAADIKREFDKKSADDLNKDLKL